jgi:hypothetical protein
LNMANQTRPNPHVKHGNDSGKHNWLLTAAQMACITVAVERQRPEKRFSHHFFSGFLFFPLSSWSVVYAGPLRPDMALRGWSPVQRRGPDSVEATSHFTPPCVRIICLK